MAADFIAADGYWNVAGNWNPAGVPANGATCNISANTARINTDLTGGVANYSHTISITNGGTLEFENGAVLARSDIVGEGSWVTLSSGALNLHAGSKLWMHTTTVGAGGSASITMDGGDVEMTGLNLGAGSQPVTVSISGGTFNNGNTTGAWQVGMTAPATVTQSGSSVVQPGRGFYLGTQSGVKGTYNLLGGTLDGTGASSGMMVGSYAAGAVGEMNIAGGTLENGVYSNGTQTLYVGGRYAGATGLVSITTGALHSPLVHVGSANGLGSGELVVSGSGADIIVGRDWGDISPNPFLRAYSNGTLTFEVGSGGVSQIHVTGTGGSSGLNFQAALAGTLNMELLGAYTPSVGQTFDLLSARTIIDNGIALALEDTSKWTMLISGTAGSGQLLQVQYVPEPASGLLGALAALALLRRRR